MSSKLDDTRGRPRRRSEDSLPLIMANKQSRPAVEIDRIDLRILSALERDGRLSKSDLAVQVGLSTSACLERMRRLERKKLILNYRAEINVRMLSRFEVFFTEITLFRHTASDFVKFEKYVRSHDKIIECFALAGGIDYIIKVVSQSVSDYQNFVDMLLNAEIGVDRYFTYIVTKAVKSLSSAPISSLDVAT